MRGSHLAVVVGGCAVIVAAGFAAAPPMKLGSAAGPQEPVPGDSHQADPNQPDPTPGATAGGSGVGGGQAQTFDGPAVSNVRGTYQAQITVVDGVVTDVVALQAGTSAAESVAVNTMAIPLFKERVLEAQSADVEAVSGASFTSPAFLESLAGAFEAAGLS